MKAARQFRPGLVTLVIPAKNEEATIGQTLRSLPLATMRTQGFDTEVLVLDGNSRDATRDIAYASGTGATVIYDPQPGKASAFRNARRWFRGDYVVMLDADGTYAVDAIPRVVGRLAWNEADIVMGRRIAQPGALTGQHRIGNQLLSLAARTLYTRRCPDLCSGLWGFQTQALAALPLQSTRFELEAELFALAARRRFRIVHVPVDYLPRQGTPKLAAWDAVRIGWCLLRSRVSSLDDPKAGTAPRPDPSLARAP